VTELLRGFFWGGDEHFLGIELVKNHMWYGWYKKPKWYIGVIYVTTMYHNLYQETGGFLECFCT
jgi:hypothetical protein